MKIYFYQILNGLKDQKKVFNAILLILIKLKKINQKEKILY